MAIGCRSGADKRASQATAAVSKPSVDTATVEPAPTPEVETAQFEGGADDFEASQLGTADASKTISEPAKLPPPADEADSETESTGEAEVVEPLSQPSELDTAVEAPLPPTVDEVVRSIVEFFPLIQQATAGRTIASGQVLEASGAFDHKLDITSDSQPLDFYENHRSSIGVKRETTWGGRTFAGYRIGRGVYEPWYLERETNKGGEFKMGFTAPLIRDRAIDANRSELWQAQIEQTRIEAEIDLAVIGSVRLGAIAYWDWVAALAKLNVAEEVLQLGLARVEGLADQIAEGEKKEIDQTDNQRIIVSRQAKVIDARRKVQQAAAKLSLFLRDPTGRPIVPSENVADPAFAVSMGFEPPPIDEDVVFASTNRPEPRELRLAAQQIGVAMRQAANETWPDVDAGLLIAQDVGERTSSKGDKSEFELEASLTLSVPLERRKAFGKLRQLRGKLAQIRAKQRFVDEKIAIDVQVSRTALEAAALRVDQTAEGLRLAQEMSIAEQVRFDEGESDLFLLNAREKQAADAASELIDAQLDYSIAAADYAAALGLSLPEIDRVAVQDVPAP